MYTKIRTGLQHTNINKHQGLRILGVVAFVVAIFTMGCTPEVSSSQAVTTTTTIKKPQPLKIALCIDQSASTGQTRVEKIDKKNILSLFAVIKKGGGELAVCAIRDQSNFSLKRLDIPSPPMAPPVPIKTGNEFEDATNQSVYKSEETKYKALHKRWEEQADKRIGPFVESLQPLINHARNANATDLAGALKRTKTYLAEPEVDWPNLKTYLVFVTDGLSSSEISADDAYNGAEMIWIDAVGNDSDLDIFRPTRFESFRAAARYISKSNASKS